MKTDPKYTNYKLSDSNNFSLKIGNRVLFEEVIEDGEIPVYSANVYEEFGKINKRNLDSFSQDSILWGIDGDWMVNVIEANKPFYPTDHCGVLRINNPNINIKYMALTLYYEGKQERFSRTNRASTERIKNLLIQIPSKPEQDEFANKINEIDNKIIEFKEQIAQYDECTKSKFDELFSGCDQQKSIGSLCRVRRGTMITRKETVNGDIPVIAGGLKPSCYHNVSNRNGDVIAVSGSRANAGFISYWANPIFASDCNTIEPLENNILMLFVYYQLHFSQKEMYKLQPEGAGQPHVYGDDIEKVLILYANAEQQKKFVAFASKYDKLKFDVQQQIELLENEREKLIEEEYK